MGIKQSDKWTFKHLYRGVFFLLLTIYIVLFIWMYSEQGKDVYAGLYQYFSMLGIIAVSIILIPVGITNIIVATRKGEPTAYAATSLLMFCILVTFHIVIFLILNKNI